ncbi:MAG: tetratricopeptide repeat protein [Cytophagales bacterium]|nr:tetratricopeptide repeat protein [Cytophagales bacterium]
MKNLILPVAFVSYLSVFAQTIDEGLKYMDIEQYANARKTFYTLANKTPQTAENLYYLGDYYIVMSGIDSSLTKEYLDSAKAAFIKAKAIDPKYAMNLVGLGTIKYLARDWDSSKVYYENAIKMGKKNARTYAKIGEGYLYKGKKDIDVAIPQIAKACELDAKNTDYMILLGDAYLIKDEGNATRAVKQYDMAVAANPKLTKAHIKKGKIWIQARNYKAALDDYNKGVSADPGYAPAYRERAELYFKLKDYRDKASAEYKKYLEMSDGNYKSKARYASILYKNNEYKAALDQISALFKINPDDRALYRLSAYCAYELGAASKDTVEYKALFSKGLADINKFIELTKDTSKLILYDYEYLGKLMIRNGMDSLGFIQVMKAFRMDSTRFDIFKDLATQLNDAKKYKAAGDAYSVYFKYKKPGLNDLLSWGRCYYNAENFVLADTVFNQIIKQKPTEILGYKWRALANDRIDKDGKSGIAIPHYTKYLELANADPAKYKNDIIRAYTYMGKYYLNTKEFKKSKEYWQKIAAIDPADQNAQIVLKQLKDVK